MKPCPFCNATKLSINRFVSDKWYTHVRCENCGAEGPHIEDKGRSVELCEDIAVGDWDTR